MTVARGGRKTVHQGCYKIAQPIKNIDSPLVLVNYY